MPLVFISLIILHHCQNFKRSCYDKEGKKPKHHQRRREGRKKKKEHKRIQLGTELQRSFNTIGWPSLKQDNVVFSWLKMSLYDTGDPKRGKDLKKKERMAWKIRCYCNKLSKQENQHLTIPAFLDIGIFFTKEYGTSPMPTQGAYREQVYITAMKADLWLFPGYPILPGEKNALYSLI